MDVWTIPVEMRAKYDAQFEIIQQGGFVTGDIARALFLKSGLPPQILAKIWALADMDADGRIDKKEFSIALWLIAMKLKGVEVPNRLPPSLLAPPARPPPSGYQSDPFAPSAGAPPPRPGPPPMPPAPVMAPIAQPIAPQQAMGRAGPPPKPPPPSHVPPPVPPAPQMSAGPPPLPPAPVMSSPQRPMPPQIPPQPASVPPPLQHQGSVEWSVPQGTKLKYTQLFNQHDRSRTGFLTGNQARAILVATGLHNTLLAQIWQLSDIDTDGRLTCEEFVLSMHLAEVVRSGQSLPSVLPADLVPPSYRRRNTLRKDSVGSQGSQGSRGAAHNDLMSPPPEIRQEQERKRQEELQREGERQKELELEREAERRRQQEQKEAARREMERQRQLEWQRQRISELGAQKQKEQEGLSLLKRRKLDLCLQVEKLSREVGEVNGKVAASKEEVATAKSFIDGMRPQRDIIMSELSAVKAQLKEVSDQTLLLNQEKLNMQNQLASLNSRAGNKKREIETKIEMARKQLMQLNNEITNKTTEVERVEQEVTNKENNKNTANHVDEEEVWGGAPKKKEVKEDPTQPKWDDPTKVDWGEEHASPTSAPTSAIATTAPTAAWGDSAPASVDVTGDSWGDPPANSWGGPVAVAASTGADTTAKYRALYEFEARNEDELSFQPGDIINVTVGQEGEPGWFAGEVRGKTGWFPEAYVEPMSGPVPAEESISVAEVRSTPLDTVTEEPTSSQVTEVASVDQGEKHISIYQYDSEEAGDLCFPANEVVYVTAKNGDWWTGTYKGVSGVFPNNYVQPIEEETPSTPAPASHQEDANGRKSETPSETKKSKKKPEIVTVVASYEASGEGQLSLVKGQLIQVRKKTDGGWWEGEIQVKGKGRKCGWFPASYVKVLAPPTGGNNSARNSPAPTQTQEGKSEKEQVKALFSFQGQQEDEITFEKGDIIIITNKDDASWWKGHRSGDPPSTAGLFPSNYVAPL